MMLGVQIWVKWVNRQGGIRGHRVELLVGDNGGDPAKNKAMAQDFVQTKKIIALIQYCDVLSGPTAREYLEHQRIPVVGTCGGQVWDYDSPMSFPQATSGLALIRAIYRSAAQNSVPRGRTKLGVLVCTEAQICPAASKLAEEEARRGGMEVVYKGQGSIAQPDFTAECLAMRSAGVEVLFPLFDPNSVRRVASSCARQGFRPTFVQGSQSVTWDMKDDPNLRDHLIVVPTVFPPFQDTTPATVEFQAAFREFGSGRQLDNGISLGWVSGKLFERAARTISEPPSKEQILAGLWSIEADSLGNVTAPLSFKEGKRPTPAICWFNQVATDGNYRSPDNYTLNCS